MKLNYHPETDSLYIDLSEQEGPSEQITMDCREISEGIVLDYDAQGNLAGINIDSASVRVELGKLIVSKLPTCVETAASGRLP